MSSTPHSHDFYHQRLVLLFLEPYISGITQYILFGVLLLSVSMFLKLIHVAVFRKFVIFLKAEIVFHCMDIPLFVYPFIC